MLHSGTEAPCRWPALTLGKLLAFLAGRCLLSFTAIIPPPACSQRNGVQTNGEANVKVPWKNDRNCLSKTQALISSSGEGGS